MRIKVERSTTRLYPDFKRVILRFRVNTDDRIKSTIRRVLGMSDAKTQVALIQILREFAKRHRNITRIFEKHFNKIKHYLVQLKGSPSKISPQKKLLIGSYFTMEYSIESAAFFNPAIVEAPDQSDLEEGQKRVYVSFRAIGEGHISSIVFRSALIDKETNLHFQPAGDRIEEAEVIKYTNYQKKSFFRRLKRLDIPDKVSDFVMNHLSDSFTYPELKNAIDECLGKVKVASKKREHIQKILWLADSGYEINFSIDTDISERVIFPVAENESKGIEDARFVRFTYDNGEVVYYALYTAHDGVNIVPKLLRTRDFFNFKLVPLHGEGAQNKNLALFPRKINNKYAMISRVDGVNHYIMFSDNINIWEDPIKLQEPRFPWEFIQMGNCGSPIETEKGWLFITHGVGPMRKYCLGASLFDLHDPTKELGRLKEPLLTPNMEEREGYVPNVVYSCGSIIHKDKLIIPYAMSDYASSYVTVPLKNLLNKILTNGDV